MCGAEAVSREKKIDVRLCIWRSELPEEHTLHRRGDGRN
jgi:hypothetical protein